MSTFPSLNKLAFGKLVTTSKGAKQIPITNEDGPLTWQPSDFLEIPFEPSNFSDKESSRVNICFAPTEEISNSLNLFESWLVKSLARQSKELLGQEQTESQIRERFQSSLRTSEKGWTSFRAKMNITGRNAVQCWNLDKTQRSPPDCWRDCKVIPKLHFKSLYVMNKDLGLIVDVTHCMVEELDKQCPFD
jgi:hypothetical protein